jgi:hypothetical protein
MSDHLFFAGHPRSEGEIRRVAYGVMALAYDRLVNVSFAVNDDHGNTTDRCGAIEFEWGDNYLRLDCTHLTSRFRPRSRFAADVVAGTVTVDGLALCFHGGWKSWVGNMSFEGCRLRMSSAKRLVRHCLGGYYDHESGTTENPLADVVDAWELAHPSGATVVDVRGGRGGRHVDAGSEQAGLFGGRP